MHDAIVVGGGIVGASTAYHLARGGAETLLVDRADAGRATTAGAGFLSPPTSRHADETWYGFALEAVGYYPTLVESLAADGVEETGYAESGVVIADPPGEDPEPFDEGRARVLDRQRRHGFPPEDRLHDISPEEASERFPPLCEVRRALYYADAARVDGGTFAAALVEAGRGYGLKSLDASVETVTRDGPGGAVSGVVADGKPYSAEAVVVAGGAWSGDLADALGIEIPVTPQRGQIVHLDLRGTATADWSLVNTFSGYYLVPWGDGQVAAGATREDGSGFAPHSTAVGVHGVLGDALALAPGLGDASVAEVRVGLRPMSADGLPAIGPVPGSPGAHVATAHGSTGLQLGPYTGKLVADAILRRPVEVDLSAFDPGRF